MSITVTGCDWMNQAVGDLVCRNLGERRWDQIRRRAGLEQNGLDAGRMFNAGSTEKLIQAASEILGMPRSAVIEGIGRHWAMVRLEEDSSKPARPRETRHFEDFLRELPDHQPSATCVSTQPDGSILVIYRSPIVDIAPFFLGVLLGTSERFGVRLDIEQSTQAEGDNYRYEFRIIKRETKAP